MDGVVFKFLQIRLEATQSCLKVGGLAPDDIALNMLSKLKTLKT